MVREFYIENEVGQRYSMMNIEKRCLLSSPSGLGYGYNIEYSQIGDEFIQNIKKIEQGKIDGELIFKNYDNYKEFVDFVESSESIKFVYRVPFNEGFVEYFKDVDLTSLEKSEKGVDGVLRVPAVFNCKSLWYEAKEIVYTIDPVSNEIRWDFRWDSVFTAYDDRNIIFNNIGHTESPFRLELNGEVSDLKITILENKEIVKQLELNGLTIASGEKFIYDTKDTNQAIYKESNGVKTNLFDFLSPNFINFYKLRKGESTIRLESDGEITNGRLTIYVQYKAV